MSFEHFALYRLVFAIRFGIATKTILMKNSLLSFSTATLLLFSSDCMAQPAFPTIEYLDVNNLRVSQLVHGDMWWHPGVSQGQAEFPVGSGNHVSNAAAIWMAGYDSQSQLRVSAQTYRQAGNDYWPGPILGSTPLTHAESETWAKIWKIEKADIDNFLQTSPHTIANTPSGILTWPAKGNPYAEGNNNTPLTINNELADFVDVNSDGMYDPLAGDHPRLRGDQMLFYVFNDFGPGHGQTNGMPLEVEVHAYVYGFKRNTLVDNVVFYDFEITNKGALDLDSFVVGFYADLDLGYFGDDMIGFDSSRRLGIVYNGLPQDGPPGYGNDLPMAGIRILQMPGTDCALPGPAGGFMYYNNTTDPQTGNPSTATHFNNYLRGHWRDGTPVTNDYAGPGTPSNGTGAGPVTRYVFNGELGDDNTWNECSAGNSPDDRRIIIASSSSTLASNEKTKLAMALVVSPLAPNNGCPTGNFNDIRIVSDTAQEVYCNWVAAGVQLPASQKDLLKLYPNPVKDELTIDIKEAVGLDLRIYDAMGRIVKVEHKHEGERIRLNTGDLVPGVYHVRLKNKEAEYKASFVKE